MNFYPTERIALFIDGANLYAAAKSLAFDIDYKRLLALFRSKGQLVRALYYTALAEEQEYSSIRPLIDWLDYNGYTMVTKPTKEFVDAAGRRKIKGNMDIELAVDAMELSEYLDHIVLFSGDGDFRSLVEALQHKGKRVSVVSTLTTNPPMVADELRRGGAYRGYSNEGMRKAGAPDLAGADRQRRCVNRKGCTDHARVRRPSPDGGVERAAGRHRQPS